MALLDDESINNDLTPLVLNNMKKSVGWMKFVSVAGIIMASLYIILLIYTLFVYLNTGFPGLGTLYIGLLIALAFLIAMLSSLVILLQYSSNLGEFLKTKRHQYLEAAFIKQKTYWIIMGVFTILAVLYTTVVFINILMNIGN